MSYPWLNAVEKTFSDRLRQDRLAHALLLSGPPDSGKVDLARSFVAAALCLEETYPACGTCRSCALDASGAHPDRHIVTFEEHPRTGELRKELVIDQVRRLSASLCLTNSISRRKAALLYPVEAMNKHTSNALLKTLEEPPGDALILLVSDAPSRLSATIRSRCQKLDVRMPGREESLGWLRSQNAGLTSGQAELALEAAAGSPLRALRLIENGGVEDYARLNDALDALLAGRVSVSAVLDKLSETDPAGLWSWISLRCAGETRKRSRAGAAAKAAANLQGEADRNRRLASTSVRKDLLLRDWLIQWSRLNG
ncbi:MAG: hypothetical protein PVI83_06460 [Lysobacterales bacterium]|jgi:DNA polymerase-3 subunit delta'